MEVVTVFGYMVGKTTMSTEEKYLRDVLGGENLTLMPGYFQLKKHGKNWVVTKFIPR